MSKQFREIYDSTVDLYEEHQAGFHNMRAYVYKDKCYECYKNYQSSLTNHDFAMAQRGGE